MNRLLLPIDVLIAFSIGGLSFSRSSPQVSVKSALFKAQVEQQAGLLNLVFNFISNLIGGKISPTGSPTPSTPPTQNQTYQAPPPRDPTISLPGSSDGVRTLAGGSATDIDKFNLCKNVNNTRTAAADIFADIFVPLKTQQEWAAFAAHPPKKVTVGDCGAAAPTGGGCDNYTVPAGVTKLKITAIGGGGAGSTSGCHCAYNMLSGGGGAYVVATVTVVPGDTVPFCVGGGGKAAPAVCTQPLDCHSTGGGAGGETTFGNFLKAGGGSNGNGWHYKNSDGRGTPATLGGVFTVSAGVTVLAAANGANVTAFGACGGNAGMGFDAANPGTGSCARGVAAKNYGGGGYGNGSYYSSTAGSNGGDGFILIEPQ
jgi:hypothetical protein